MNSLILDDTLRTAEHGRYSVNGKDVKMKLTAEEQEQAIVYLPEQVYELFGEYERKKGVPVRCYIHVENMDTFEAARRLKTCDNEKVAVLNFANPVSPGGGVRRGARAQEEQLCLRSTLLRSLESQIAEPYYVYNQAASPTAGSDAVLLSETVEVFKDMQMNYLNESFVISVISCAAPMVSPFSHRLEDVSQEEMEDLLYRRILCILITLIVRGHRRVVLGAWGCGVFCNDPEVVAKQFQRAFQTLEAEYYFDEIMFAILSPGGENENLRAFRKVFGAGE